MKSIFKKKEVTKPSQETLQDLQAQFNQVMFELGDLNYRKHMINQELSKINSEINARIVKSDDMGVRAHSLRQRIQDEVKKTAAEGAKNETPA